MDRARLPLHALRAFEAAARHLNFTRAAIELCVSQGAVSQQVVLLERSLGVPLFRRLPRGLALTDEGMALMPIVGESFDRIGAALDRYSDGRLREVLTIGVVGTFAIGWLVSRLGRFAEENPQIDLRMMTNNNRVDLAAEGLDMAIRFGNGVWHSLDAEPIMPALLSPLCTPSMAERLREPAALSGVVLLRSYRADEWPRWFAKAGAAVPSLRGPVFDSSLSMIEAAKAGLGVALAPVSMFEEDLAAGRLVAPFSTEIDLGAYWLTKLSSRRPSSAMIEFSRWVQREVAAPRQSFSQPSGADEAVC